MSAIEFTSRAPTGNASTASRALARAIVAARRAPSVFNSQPWRWLIADGVAHLRADRERGLRAIDPDGRLLTVSCGAALHHARVALAGMGVLAEVSRFPDPVDPDLLARIQVTGLGVAEPAAIREQQAMALRRTDRWPFADIEVPAELVERLRAAAEAQGAHLHVLRPDAVVTLSVAAQVAAAAELADPAYRAELAEWTVRSAAYDGVPALTAVAPGPRVVPLRDFTPGAPVPQSGDVVDRHACYAVLFTDSDTARSWLAAGEALSAVLLTATMDRLAASPMSDVVEAPASRRLMRELLSGIGYPTLALRLGVPADVIPPAATARRPADETIDIDNGRSA